MWNTKTIPAMWTIHKRMALPTEDAEDDTQFNGMTKWERTQNYLCKQWNGWQKIRENGALV